MSYDYKTERPNVFTEEGQRMFLKIRDRAKELIRMAGCARSQEMMSGVCGSSWTMLACIDRLVELGEIVEILPDGKEQMGQYRIFREPFSD